MGMRGIGKPPQWEWELPALPWDLFPKVLCCDELIKLLVLYLPDANAYCAEFADYRNVIYSALVRVCAYRALGKPTFPFPVH